MKRRTKVAGLLLAAVLLVAGTAFGTLAYLTSADTVTNTFTVGKVNIKLDEAEINDEGKPIDEDEKVVTDLKEAKRVDGNEYRLLPGHVYTKDPTVTVDASSEDCYVRMLVTVENIDELKAAFPTQESNGENDSDLVTEAEVTANEDYYDENGIFLLQYLVAGWDNDIWAYENCVISGNNETATYEFRYVGNKCAADEGYVDMSGGGAVGLTPLFTEIELPGDLIDNEDLAHLENVKIVCVAHAIQADGFADTVDETTGETTTAVENAWAAFDGQHS